MKQNPRKGSHDKSGDSHLDDGNYIGSSDTKLGHVDGKMIQAVPLGFHEDEIAAIAYGMDTA